MRQLKNEWHWLGSVTTRLILSHMSLSLSGACIRLGCPCCILSLPWLRLVCSGCILICLTAIPPFPTDTNLPHRRTRSILPSTGLSLGLLSCILSLLRCSLVGTDLSLSDTISILWFSGLRLRCTRCSVWYASASVLVPIVSGLECVVSAWGQYRFILVSALL